MEQLSRKERPGRSADGEGIEGTPSEGVEAAESEDEVRTLDEIIDEYAR